jgi:glycogen(starch) synthase
VSGDNLSPPPSVALFPSSFAPHLGGVEELSKRLVLQLRSRGSDTVVITNRYPRDLPTDEDIDSIPVHRERFRFPEPKPRHLAGWLIGTTAARRGVRDVMSRHGSELVHVQCVSSNGYYALRAASRGNLPLVVSLHGELTMDADQIYQRSATMRRSWRRLLGAADVVTGCSQQVVDEAVAAYGDGLATKTRVQHNGIDLARVRAAQPEVHARPYVLGLGRLVPQKGFDLLIDAFERTAADHPDVDLVLAGEGPERQALEARAHAGRVSDRIVFLGGVPAERAFALFRGAAGFVLPSRHEPQGIVLLEAMAAGCPVIATRVGGVPETIRDGENGLLVAGEDVEAVANGLAALLQHPEAGRARAERASADVEGFDWSRIADQYLQCYQDAFAAHRRRVGVDS